MKVRQSVYQLAALTPGASSQINGYVNTPFGGDANAEFDGLRQNHNIYLLDGGEDDDRGGAGGMSIAPSTDAIAEFRALTSNYSADYGLSSAATMTLVLKSGTSTLHASAWEFNRNDAFDARNFFNPATNQADDYQIRDDISLTKGAHQLRFGGSWAIYKKVQDLFGTTQGSFGFDGTFTGNDFADFLLGTAKSYGELAVQDHGFWNNGSWASYVQDNCRVSGPEEIRQG